MYHSTWPTRTHAPVGRDDARRGSRSQASGCQALRAHEHAAALTTTRQPASLQDVKRVRPHCQCQRDEYPHDDENEVAYRERGEAMHEQARRQATKGWGPGFEEQQLRAIAPETRLAALVREREYTHTSRVDVVDDAVGKTAQWKPTNLTVPNGTKVRLLGKQRCCALEFRDECLPELGVGLARIEQSAFDEFLLSFGCERNLHERACRAR